MSTKLKIVSQDGTEGDPKPFFLKPELLATGTGTRTELEILPFANHHASELLNLKIFS